MPPRRSARITKETSPEPETEPAPVNKNSNSENEEPRRNTSNGPNKSNSNNNASDDSNNNSVSEMNIGNYKPVPKSLYTKNFQIQNQKRNMTTAQRLIQRQKQKRESYKKLIKSLNNRFVSNVKKYNEAIKPELLAKRQTQTMERFLKSINHFEKSLQDNLKTITRELKKISIMYAKLEKSIANREIETSELLRKIRRNKSNSKNAQVIKALGVEQNKLKRKSLKMRMKNDQMLQNMESRKLILEKEKNSLQARINQLKNPHSANYAAIQQIHSRLFNRPAERLQSRIAPTVHLNPQGPYQILRRKIMQSLNNEGSIRKSLAKKYSPK